MFNKILYVLIEILSLFILVGCNSICYYEETDNGDVFYNEFGIPKFNNEIGIEFSYLEQENLLYFSDFETMIFTRTNSKIIREFIKNMNVSLDIYTLDGELIEPIESINNLGGVRKRYKYSLFFPKRVLIRGEISFTYKEEFYKYTKECEIVKKRNRTWWSVAKGI
jgi:hypothetical protein